jgi:hypothetical protein
MSIARVPSTKKPNVFEVYSREYYALVRGKNGKIKEIHRPSITFEICEFCNHWLRPHRELVNLNCVCTCGHMQ